MNTKASSSHTIQLFIATLLTMIALSTCSSCNMMTGPGMNATATPRICEPYCARLTQPGIEVVGQVNNVYGFAKSGLSGGGSPTVVLNLPMGSSYSTNNQITVIVENPPFPLHAGDYLKVMVTPTNPPTNEFLAVSISMATSQQFLNQNIEYQGTETEPVICPCKGSTKIFFVVNKNLYSFAFTDQNIVQGFGSPPMIRGGSKIDVIVNFQYVSGVDSYWQATVKRISNPIASQ